MGGIVLPVELKGELKFNPEQFKSIGWGAWIVKAFLEEKVIILQKIKMRKC